MTTAENSIRARRRLTNRLIAAHDAARLRPFLDPDVKLIAGDGALILGAAAVIAAFEAQFAEPDFVAYVRETEIVELDRIGARAAEHGRWNAISRGGPQPSGAYLAVWKRVVGQWVIESELYVTLEGDA